jgi:hypothetical protein
MALPMLKFDADIRQAAANLAFSKKRSSPASWRFLRIAQHEFSRGISKVMMTGDSIGRSLAPLSTSVPESRSHTSPHAAGKGKTGASA